ncbi:sucrase ferredoxin [Pseudonocardia sp. GCM10023141]|uniref:sucrase ferredoxin n=1 Tax=Pseudonocardia sp. GCM10023141 TaxID=3252653 RepID=UPI003613BBC8
MSMRCSLAADAAGDAREGTAPRALRWFLLEHRGPWGPGGLVDSRIHPALVHALQTWASDVGGRVLLIRRHGRRDAGPARRWFRIDARPGQESLVGGSIDRERDLSPTAPGAPESEPLFLVCAHGKHDTCCAVRGRPLAAAVAAAEPARTWECSHVGGCRFAPATVLMPHAFVLGGVPAPEAAAVTAGYRGGTVDPRWLRGRTALEPAVQAAQHHARAKTGALGVDALAPVDVTGTGRYWRVRLTDPDCTVVLQEHSEPAGRPLTCAATQPGRQRRFELVELVLG